MLFRSGKLNTEFGPNDFAYLTISDIKYSANGDTKLTDEYGTPFDANDDDTIRTFTININGKYWAAALQRFGITATRIETEWDDEGRAIKWDYKFNGGIYRKNADLEMTRSPENLVSSITNYVANDKKTRTQVVVKTNVSYPEWVGKKF